MYTIVKKGQKMPLHNDWGYYNLSHCALPERLNIQIQYWPGEAICMRFLLANGYIHFHIIPIDIVIIDMILTKMVKWASLQCKNQDVEFMLYYKGIFNSSVKQHSTLRLWDKQIFLIREVPFIQ